VLSDVSLEVGAGECVALVGRSGAGKTTLARCAIGLHPRWDGAIVLDGSPLAVGVRDRPVAQRSALQYVFQNPYRSLNPRRTVAESVGMPLRRLFGLGRAELRARVELMLEEVTLPRALASRYPAELSGGERQLVAIVRALACEPCVLICDEVTSSLDRSSEATVVAALERLQSERRLSILFISHDIALARALAHRVAVILQGRIVEEGPAAEVFAAPRHVHTRELVATTHDLATAERGVATAVS
jgi:peptide/nickel transport system ATP-binding protein